MEEGSPYHLVTPRAPRDGRIFRPVVLVASALVLTCVVAVVVSGPSSRSELVGLAPGQSSEVPLELMPDPAEAVRVARETIGQVDPFHRDGAWIGKCCPLLPSAGMPLIPLCPIFQPKGCGGEAYRAEAAVRHQDRPGCK